MGRADLHRLHGAPAVAGGLGRALDLLLTGRAVGAAEALQMGLATRLVPAGQARVDAESLARRMAAFPQAALRSDRQSAHAQNGLPMEEALRQETSLAADARRTEARPSRRVRRVLSGRACAVGISRGGATEDAVAGLPWTRRYTRRPPAG